MIIIDSPSADIFCEHTCSSSRSTYLCCRSICISLIHLHAQHPPIFSKASRSPRCNYIYLDIHVKHLLSSLATLLNNEHLCNTILQLTPVSKTLVYCPGCLQMSRYLHEPITWSTTHGRWRLEVQLMWLRNAYRLSFIKDFSNEDVKSIVVLMHSLPRLNTRPSALLQTAIELGDTQLEGWESCIAGGLWWQPLNFTDITRSVYAAHRWLIEGLRCPFNCTPYRLFLANWAGLQGKF